jgi:hypothetical protein
MQDGKTYAVLTGDIIKSSRFSPDQLREQRKELCVAMERLQEAMGEDIMIGQIDFFRGDGWQLLLSSPAFALRSCLILRAALLMSGSDTRISVGVGTVDSIDREHISRSVGEAFEISGAGLDVLKKRDYLMINGDLESLKLIKSVFSLCDALVQRFTQRQAEAVYWILQKMCHNSIGQALKPSIKRSSVAKLLADSGWLQIEKALKVIEP